MSFEDIVSAAVDVIWSPIFVFVCLAAGLLFSILTRFVQIRHFKEMIRLLFKNSGNQNHRRIDTIAERAERTPGEEGIHIQKNQKRQQKDVSPRFRQF